jgi:hypothetical protein
MPIMNGKTEIVMISGTNTGRTATRMIMSVSGSAIGSPLLADEYSTPLSTV